MSRGRGERRGVCGCGRLKPGGGCASEAGGLVGMGNAWKGLHSNSNLMYVLYYGCNTMMFQGSSIWLSLG